MSPYSIHIWVRVLLAATVCALAFSLYGALGLAIAWAACTTLWLYHNLRGIRQFTRALHAQSPNQTISFTNGHGLWAQLLSDIHRRDRVNRKHRTQLHRTVQRFQAAAESMPEAIVLLNKNGRIQWFNHLAIDYFSLSPEHALGSALHKHIANTDCQAFLQAACTSNPQELRFTLNQDNGRMRHIRLIRTAFMQQSELIIAEDISRVEQLQAMRTAFVANVSHELRTPLTVINGFLETLADYPDLPSEQRAQFVALMQNESQRMLNLIHDLMTLSALEDPQQQTAPKAACNISDLVQQIVQDAQRLSAGKHQIIADIEADISLLARERELYQALSNLVFNAVRHAGEGCQIHIGLQRIANPNPYKPPLAQFSVRDTGKGIAPEHLPHLTDRFYRADSGRSRENGGTGLGLAIAKHALANHQASLHIRSELGVGSEFMTQLPT